MHRLLALTAASVLAVAPGSLDRTFGVHGKVTTRIGSDAGAHAVAVQPDGKVVAAGYAKTGGHYVFALARYTAHGRLDRSFGRAGIAKTAFESDSFAYALALQRDGKLVVVGSTSDGSRSRMALSRYRRDGSLDRSFGRRGKVVTSLSGNALAVAIQRDGKIVVGGGANHAFVLLRYRRDGIADKSFGTGGVVTTVVTPGSGAFGNVTSLEVGPDGKIVAAGSAGGHEWSEIAVARYTRAGALDQGFGSRGVATAFDQALSSNFAAGVVLQPDGRIVVGGSASASFALLRFRSNGSLDPTFGSDGPGWTFSPQGASAFALTRQPDGRLLLAGAGPAGKRRIFTVARYTRDGAIDHSFGAGTGSTSTALGKHEDVGYGVDFGRDGRIVVAGAVNEYGPGGGSFGLVRYVGTR